MSEETSPLSLFDWQPDSNPAMSFGKTSPASCQVGGGHDFGSIAEALVECGFGIAWRILDAQFYGVPQRRRRLFLIGCAGNDVRRAEQVLFDGDGVCRHSHARRATGKDIAHCVTARFGSGRADPTAETYIAAAIAPTLNAGGNKTGGTRPPGTSVDTAESLIVTDISEVTHTLRGEGFDGSEDGTGRGTPLIPIAFSTEQTPKWAEDLSPTLKTPSPSGGGQPMAVCVPPEDEDAVDAYQCHGGNVGPMGTLRAGGTTASNGVPFVPVAFCQNQAGDVISGEVMHNLATNGNATGRNAPTILCDSPIWFNARQDPIDDIVVGAMDGHGYTNAIAFDPNQITSRENRSNPQPGNPCHTIPARHVPPAIAFSCKNDGTDVGDVSPTLRAMGHANSHPNSGGQVAVSIPHGVRRITPREAERLQGFPDDYTLVPYRKAMAADGPRYKAIGNSMAVPVIRWIGERIMATESDLANEESR